MKNSIKISICLMSIILVCFSLFGCKKNKNLEIEFLPNTNNVFLNELVTIYAKDFDSKIGKLIITEDNLIFLEQQLAACIERGYVKIPDLDVRNELFILVNFYSAYKEFGMALMNANKNFFIDLDHYSFEINSYFQKYVDYIVIK
ncbi:MAG: hypothetical protein K6B17_07150 [Treponema sp.]|nr:hypothetical protein [Treponema sp.]